LYKAVPCGSIVLLEGVLLSRVLKSKDARKWQRHVFIRSWNKQPQRNTSKELLNYWINARPPESFERLSTINFVATIHN
jgi:hypothetical protein